MTVRSEWVVAYQKSWMEDTHRRSYRQFLTELTIQFSDTYIELTEGLDKIS